MDTVLKGEGKGWMFLDRWNPRSRLELSEIVECEYEEGESPRWTNRQSLEDPTAGYTEGTIVEFSTCGWLLFPGESIA